MDQSTVNTSGSGGDTSAMNEIQLYQEYDRLLDKASEARGVRDYDTAHGYINQAIRMQPYRFKAYYRRGLLCWRNGQLLDTYRAMRQAMLFCQSQPEQQCKYWTLLFEGCLAELDKDLTKAEYLYAAAIDCCTQDSQHQQFTLDDYIDEKKRVRPKRRLLNLSFSFFKQKSSGDQEDDLHLEATGNSDESISPPVKQQLSHFTEDMFYGFEAYLNLGIVKMEQSRHAEAISLFYKSLKQTTKLHLIALCYNNIACCYVRQLNDQLALKFFTKAIETYPYDVLFCINRMRTNRRLENYQEALKDCHSVISLTKHPKTLAEAYADKADIIRKMNRDTPDNVNNTSLTPVDERTLQERNHELVCKYYEKSIASDPTYEYTYLIMTAVCADHNQMDRALDCSERGIRNCRHDDWQSRKELHRIRAAVYGLCIAKKSVQQTAQSVLSTHRDRDEQEVDDCSEDKPALTKMTSPYSNNILNLPSKKLVELEALDRADYALLSTEVGNRIC